MDSEEEVIDSEESQDTSESVADTSEDVPIPSNDGLQITDVPDVEPIVMDDTNELLMSILDTTQYIVAFQVVIICIILIALFFIALKAGKSQ